MKIAIAQISSILGNVDRNIERHLELMEKAIKEKADLIVFPELSLTGYTLRDLVAEVALDPFRSSAFSELLSASKKIDAIVGLVEERKSDPGLFYNSAAYLSAGQIKHIHRKVFLPTSGMFEEGRFFRPGGEFSSFPTRFVPTGLLICRDFLHYGSSYCLLADGAQLMITISAAPGRGVSDPESQGFETSRMWELMGETISFFSGAVVVYCNRVGVEDGATFAGGSFIYSPFGKLIIKLPYLEEAFCVQEVDLEEIRVARKSWPFKRDDRPEIIWRSLERIVRKKEDED
ncbi:MAG: nitrilase-related carbon-nitrogen hydrolase [Candidatus Saccharicenans sp.]